MNVCMKSSHRTLAVFAALTLCASAESAAPLRQGMESQGVRVTLSNRLMTKEPVSPRLFSSFLNSRSAGQISSPLSC